MEYAQVRLAPPVVLVDHSVVCPFRPRLAGTQFHLGRAPLVPIASRTGARSQAWRPPEDPPGGLPGRLRGGPAATPHTSLVSGFTRRSCDRATVPCHLQYACLGTQASSNKHFGAFWRLAAESDMLRLTCVR